MAVLAFASLMRFDHRALVGGGAVSPLLSAALFLLDWLAMCAAMMTLPALPMIAAVERLGQRSGRSGLPALTWLGLLGAWAAFGLALYAAAQALGASGSVRGFVAIHWRAAVGGFTVLSALYMWSPLALRCARGCRSPQSVIATSWTGSAKARRNALVIGLRYGANCVGCCWPQMALLSVLGLHSPAIMLLASGAMAAQKSAAFGQWVHHALALALLALGLAIALGGLDFPLHGAIWQMIAAWCAV
jgi:predicted metal-binding membrane protein